MLVLNDVCYDSRVRAEAATLASAGYAVRVIGILPAGSPLPDHETLRWMGNRACSLRRLDQFPAARAAAQTPASPVPDGAARLSCCVARLPTSGMPMTSRHCCPSPWPVSGRRQPGKLVYDSHEMYFFREAEPHQPVHRMVTALEGWLARRADLIPDQQRLPGRVSSRALGNCPTGDNPQWHGAPA